MKRNLLSKYETLNATNFILTLKKMLMYFYKGFIVVNYSS